MTTHNASPQPADQVSQTLSLGPHVAQTFSSRPLESQTFSLQPQVAQAFSLRPLVSVMMPVYNAQDYLAQAVDSVLGQTYENWELVIVDDGSTDRSAEIAKSYADPRIRLFRQENAGESVARNQALLHMTGEYVAFLDADDYFLPNHLELSVGYLMDHPDRDGVYTNGAHCDQAGTLLQQTLSDRRRGPFEGWVFEQVVRASDVFGPPICVVLRREPITRLDLTFDPQIVIGPDWDFLTRFSETTRFGYIDQITCCYRIHQTNISVQVDMKRRALYLARCREKAIKLTSFAGCSFETRSAVFYDLLVNLLDGYPERQTRITSWPEFEQLGVREQARLYRLMASRAIRSGSQDQVVIEWLRKSRACDPADRRAAMLSAFYRFSPALLGALLRIRKRVRKETGLTPVLQEIK